MKPVQRGQQKRDGPDMYKQFLF